jgi:signal peptidase I
VMVSGISMEPTLHNGDLVIAHRRESYRVGDTVVYRVPKGDTGAGSMIIHRIVGGSALSGWNVRGDNKEIPDLWHPKSSDIAGSLWVSVPGAGRLLAYALSPFPLAMISTFIALLIGLPGAAVDAVESRSRRRIWQPERVTAAVVTAAAFVRPFVRTDALVIVFRKPRLPIPVSFPRAEISALISERVRPALQGLGTAARAWGEAAWTARDLYRSLLPQG